MSPGPPSPKDLGTIAGDRGDHPRPAINAPHATIEPIDDEQVATAADDDAVRLVELGFCAGPSSPEKPALPLPATVVIVPLAGSIRRMR